MPKNLATHVLPVQCGIHFEFLLHFWKQWLDKVFGSLNRGSLKLLPSRVFHPQQPAINRQHNGKEDVAH
jgi:hypothetical protein